MKEIKFAIAVCAVCLAVFTGPAQAYIVNWKFPYTGGIPLFTQTDGAMSSTTLIYYPPYGYDRSVQLWQTFLNTGPNTPLMVAVSFQLGRVKASGCIDLNVYEGVGVKAENLISSTKLEWDDDFAGGYYGFKLDMPIRLKVMTNYTVSLENMISTSEFVPVLKEGGVRNRNNAYFQQGWFGGKKGDPEGYMSGVSDVAINFIIQVMSVP